MLLAIGELYRFFGFFFFNDTATTEIYTLSLHDALPIYDQCRRHASQCFSKHAGSATIDRKSTRLNSSHVKISYAVFCLKNKKTIGLDPISKGQCSPVRSGDILVFVA